MGLPSLLAAPFAFSDYRLSVSRSSSKADIFPLITILRYFRPFLTLVTVFYVDRKDNYFHCPRDCCPHKTSNTVSFGLHVRHTCKQPWPEMAPDPPEADLAKDVKEEAEGKKRRRGGGRGKGAMKKRATTTTTTPPPREDSPSKEVLVAQKESAAEVGKEEDNLESEFERAWEADFAGWNPFGKIKSRRVVDILHRLPLLREEALSILTRIVSADPMMSAEKGQRVRRLQEDIALQKGEVLYFVRWVGPLLFLVFFFSFSFKLGLS